LLGTRGIDLKKESHGQNKKPPGSFTWGPLLQAKSEELFTNNKGKKLFNYFPQILAKPEGVCPILLTG
jgi:hypothetical protein